MVEIFDKTRDGAMNGYADEIEVAILPGDVIRVVDNGTGIPVEKHKDWGFHFGNGAHGFARRW